MFISMWISNTAATAMMIPIMETVLIELESVSLHFFRNLDYKTNAKKNNFSNLFTSARTWKHVRTKGRSGRRGGQGNVIISFLSLHTCTRACTHIFHFLFSRCLIFKYRMMHFNQYSQFSPKFNLITKKYFG